MVDEGFVQDIVHETDTSERVPWSVDKRKRARGREREVGRHWGWIRLFNEDGQQRNITEWVIPLGEDWEDKANQCL